MSGPADACRALAALALLTALTACGSPTAAPTATSRTLLADTPRVAEPRDLRPVPTCQLLTPAQVESFGLDPGTAELIEDDGTEICQYRGRDGRSRADVTTAYRYEVGGLDRLYRNREFIRVFRPGTLDGYPTVTTNPEDATVSCDFYVGVADDQILLTTANRLPSSSAPPPCQTARAIASAVLSNLPPSH